MPRSNPKDGFMACHHWFDGVFTTHKFDLISNANGACNVTYMSYCHVDESIESARKTGKLEGVTFAQKRDPCESSHSPGDQNSTNAIQVTHSTRSSRPSSNPSFPAALTALRVALRFGTFSPPKLEK